MPEPETVGPDGKYKNGETQLERYLKWANGQPPKRQLPDAEEMAAGGCHR